MTEALGEGFKISASGGGLVIQAGDAPALGDVNRALPLPLYHRLARVLEPLRPRIHGGFHTFSLTREQSEAWLHRFDTP